MSTHSQLLLEIEQMAGTATSAEKLMQEISDRLHAGLARYNWVGFYLVDPKEPGVRVVGPYTGSLVPQQRIPFGQGMSGAAAASGKTLVANIVTGVHNSVSGLEMVNQQLVGPLFVTRTP